ncbi:MAG TPA: YceI family protein [Casimicrobiaceae bacterium]|nr:YceI family protein [Casimicrobiaceae bacterium]
MTRTLTFLFALAFPAVALAVEDTYVLDPVHSQPMFEIQHMMGFSNQRGTFNKLAGKVTLDRAEKKGTVDITIDTTSVRSLNEKLETHLKSEDFFNVAKYPTMTFKSTNVVFDGDRVVGVDGDLTMIGVTKPVSLKVENFRCGDHPFNKKPMCGAEASVTIKRSEWGMKYGIPKAVSDDVRLILPIEAYKEQP